jgi:hypothetical protein
MQQNVFRRDYQRRKKKSKILTGSATGFFFDSLEDTNYFSRQKVKISF